MSFLNQTLFKNVNSFSLGLFRFVFGVFMLIEMIYYLKSGFFKDSVMVPYYNFPYDYLEFISPMGDSAMSFIHFMMGLSAILIMIGYYSRWASLLFFICFTYFLLCCRGLFNNHFYLFSLLSLLFVFLDADRSFSIRPKNKAKEKVIPMWQLNILRFQIVVVYFFGGVAKLTHDWLVLKEPMRETLKSFSPNGFIPSELMVSLFNYGGLAFDLSIGFLLLFRRTRTVAIIGVVLFNLTNAIIFDDIAIFPFVMLGTIVLFLDPEGKAIVKIKSFFVNNRGPSIKRTAGEYHQISKPVILGVVVYVLFQVLFPLRHHLITDNVVWTGIARKFSWHMKVQQRTEKEISFLVKDKLGGEEIMVDYNFINQRINNLQIGHMSQSPVMAWQFANWLEKRLNKELKAQKNKSFKDLEIYCTIQTSFNGRPAQYIIDPSIDLTKAPYSPFGANTWIMPLKEYSSE